MERGDGFAKNFTLRRDSLDVEYCANFMAVNIANPMLKALLIETPWLQPELKMYGKRVKTPRLSCWYGDPSAVYSYSGLKNEPRPWTRRLSELRKQVQDVTQEDCNSVLLNLYRDGNDHVSWHSDDEPELGRRPLIASVSLGAPRRFDFRPHCKSESQARHMYNLELAHGSLLLMRGETQSGWQHRIARARGITDPRINLTFRCIKLT